MGPISSPPTVSLTHQKFFSIFVIFQKLQVLFLRLNGKTATSDNDIAQLFNDFFSVFTRNLTPLPSVPSITHNQDVLCSITFTDVGVFSVLSTLNPTKAKGVDNIGPAILKACGHILFIPVHHLFQLSLSSGVIPDNWLTHVITPIHISGYNSSVQNYRPISLFWSISKVLERLILKES